MRVAACSLVLALAACSDGGAIVTVDAGVDAAIAHARPFVCPSAPPRQNAPCALEGTSCEYGTSSDATCNGTIACTLAPGLGLYWNETPGRACTCPADVRDGQACAGDAVCPGGLELCGCVAGTWRCARPEEGCPPDRPRRGQPCLGELVCDYGPCLWSQGARMVCADEVWQVGEATCR